MKGIHTTPLIDASDPFGTDKQDRRSAIEHLTTYVSNIGDPYVILLNGSWGSGKTHFVRMWNAHLQSLNIPTIFLNAWETDFVRDPFVALLGQVGGEIEKLKGARKTKGKRVLDRLGKSASSIIANGLPAFVRVISSGLINLDESAKKEITELLSHYTEDRISEYQASQKEFSAFRSSLEEYISLLRDSCNGPMIFFIDELDRCRPDYSIEMIETIKHLFCTQGIVFVLVSDRRQLEESIKGLYGSGFDANRYLHKFYDIEYRLPSMLKDSFIEDLLEKQDFNNISSQILLEDSPGEALAFISRLSELFELELRDIEKFIIQIVTSVRSYRAITPIKCRFIIYLSFLKTFEPELLNSLKNKKVSTRAGLMLESNKSVDWNNYIGTDEGAILEAYLDSYLNDFNKLEDIFYRLDESTRLSSRQRKLRDCIRTNIIDIRNGIKFKDIFDAIDFGGDFY